MIDWQRVCDDGYSVPADVPIDQAVAELSEMLRSPDPVVRDRYGYGILATWIGRGVLEPDQLDALGHEMAGRLVDPEIQARTFAALILDCVVTAGRFDPAWVERFESWYAGETDLRGYDERVGWLHAVAHGADLLGTLGSRAEVEPDRMLRLAATRMLIPTEYCWQDLEDERLATAVARILARPGISAADASGWLDITLPEIGLPVSANRSNTVHTLRALYVLADRGPLTHRTHVLDRIADLLAP